MRKIAIMLRPKQYKKKQAIRRTTPQDTIEQLERCLTTLRASRDVFKKKFPQTYAALELRTNEYK